MKRLILFLALCLTASACSTLRIVYNSKDSDGKRIYCTSNVHLFGEVSAAMGAKVGPKDTLLAIVITCDKDSDHGVINKGDKMMIRLQDSSVINLQNLYDKEYQLETNTYQTNDVVSAWGYEYCYSPWTDGVFVAPYEVRGFIPRTRVTQTSHSYGLYLITKEQIYAIMKKGVVKLRIEIEDRDLDMTYPENATGIFTQLYTFLHEATKKGVVRNEF